jgi:hypothetical protein
MSFIPKNLPQYIPKNEERVASTYGVFHRALIAVLVIAISLWGGKIILYSTQESVHINAWAWLALGYIMIMYMSITLWTSQTTLTRVSLKQDWFWRKSVQIDQVSYVRFIRVIGWEWLISPRLLVRSGNGPFIAFYAASPDMWIEFQYWHDAFTSPANDAQPPTDSSTDL